MGHAKDLAIQEEEQGWKSSPGVRICYHCLDDKELVEYVQAHAIDHDCDFCDRSSRKKPSSIAFDDLVEVIGDTLHQYYDRAVDVMGWDGEEQQYFGTTYDSSDLVRGHWGTISENENVLQAIVDSLGDEIWCDRHPYSTTGFEAYEIGWEQFCNAVKHQTRYFFGSRDNGDEHDPDITPVAEVLEEISGMLEEQDLITVVDPGTVFTRARIHEPAEQCREWKSLGPPSAQRAPSNRMSAAGISMFYGSTNVATAKAEAIASVKPGKTVGITTASWSTTRALNMLNLCTIPPTPSFWFSPREYRDKIRFLRAFTDSITQPVVHDGREHIEYVPTQILTEYFRHEYCTHDGRQIDGILYPSAQAPRGENVVIFVSQEDLTPTAERSYSTATPVLTLNPASIRRLHSSRLVRRAAPLPANRRGLFGIDAGRLDASSTRCTRLRPVDICR